MARPRREPRDAGLTDRSERPTTHARFAPTEARKQQEEKKLRRKGSR
jgi:hypothetical protein